MAVTATEPVAPAATEPVAPAATDEAERTFSLSIVISAVRCTLTYVVFPWGLPLLGVAGGVGPGIGLVIGSIAIVFNVWSIRRFWGSDHRYKWPITILNLGVVVLLSILVVIDLSDLLG